MYVIRYIAGTPLRERKHVFTLGRWDNFGDAEDVRLQQPNADRLEVVHR